MTNAMIKKLSTKKILIIFLMNILYLLFRHLSASRDFIFAASTGNPIISPSFRLVPEIITLVAMLLALFSKNKKVGKYWSLFILLLLITLLVDSLLIKSSSNSFDFIRILSSIRTWLIWLSPFFIGLLLLNRKDLDYFYLTIVIISILQLPLILYQSQTTSNADLVTGIMGEYGSGILAIFQAISALIVLELIFEKKISRFFGGMLIVLILIPVILAKALIVFIIIPISFFTLAVISKSSKRKSTNIILTCFFIVIQLALMIIVFIKGYGGHIDNPGAFIINKIYVALENSPTSYGGPTRIYYLKSVYNNISESPLTFIFGHGLGYASSSRLSVNTINEIILKGSTGVGSLVATLLLENGVMGVLLILMFLWGIFSNQLKNKEQNKILLTDYRAIGLVTLLIIGSLIFYNKSFTSPTLAWVLMPQLGIYAQKHTKNDKSIR